MSFDEIDSLVLSKFPYPLAVNYHRTRELQTWENKTQNLVRLFEYGIRTVVIPFLNQYLIYDAKHISDNSLNEFLVKKLEEKKSLGDWVNYLFLCLSAYKNHREHLFIHELYEFYWEDISSKPRKKKCGRDTISSSGANSKRLGP